MAASTRQRMLASTAQLIRERGARATSIDDVLTHSGAPRGSVYHHFPGGREQLLREATELASDFVAARLADLGDDPLAVARRLRRVRRRRLPGRRRRRRGRDGGAGRGRRRLRPLAAGARRGPGARGRRGAPRHPRHRRPRGSDRHEPRPVRPRAAGERARPAPRSPEGRAPMTDWQPTACILCECNCGIEVALEGRTLAKIRGDKAHLGSQGYTCNKAMRLDHYQNGRHRLQSPLRRRADGTFEEIDWDTAITEVAAKLAAIPGPQLLYYGGGGQGNHLGGAYSGALLRALGASPPLRRARPGEDGRGAGRPAAAWGPRTRAATSSTPRSSVFVGKNPWMSQSFPRARVVLKEIAKDPARAMIVLDPVVTDTARDGRRPPAGQARLGRVVPGRDGRRARAGGPVRRRLAGRARQRGRRGPRGVRRRRRRRLRARAAASTPR